MTIVDDRATKEWMECEKEKCAWWVDKKEKDWDFGGMPESWSQREVDIEIENINSPYCKIIDRSSCAIKLIAEK